MPVNIADWSETPASNTSVDGVNIAENCSPGVINNAIRSVMAGVRTFYGKFPSWFLTAVNGTADAAAFRTAIGAASAADVSGTPEGVVPTGGVIYYAKNALPTGFLRCDGTAVSRTTYSALFAVIGTTFGSGDGTTTFNVPDLRGEFIRGFDDARGVDASRVFGSAQADAFKAHTHTVPEGSSSPGGSTYTSGDDYTSTVATNSTSGSTGGSETRPRNVALLAIIKT